MRAKPRRLVSFLATAAVAASMTLSSHAETTEVTHVFAPFPLASVCYKIPGLHIAEYCEQERFEPATTGSLAAGGARQLPRVVPDAPTGPLYSAVITKMGAGAGFTDPRAGELVVIAELVGLRQTAGESSIICLRMGTMNVCADEGPVPGASAAVQLSGTLRVPANADTKIMVWAETNYLGAATALIRSLEVRFTPDSVSTES